MQVYLEFLFLFQAFHWFTGKGGSDVTDIEDQLSGPHAIPQNTSEPHDYPVASKGPCSFNSGLGATAPATSYQPYGGNVVSSAVGGASSSRKNSVYVRNTIKPAKGSR